MILAGPVRRDVEPILLALSDALCSCVASHPWRATRGLPRAGSRVTDHAMTALRSPLLPVGLFLIVLGLGNWYTGIDKGAEYERLLAAGNLPTSVEHFEDFRQLDARTTATLLSPLQRGSDEYTIANAKLDFYEVVQSGGRLLVLAGLFCAAAGVIRSWRRQRLAERGLVPLRHR
jgi:uncharacterized membrane protein YidH (DUF202 family)